MRMWEDQDSYTLIVEKYSDMLFRIAYQNLYHTEDAKDVVQDVFVKLLKQKQDAFENEEHIKAWLIRVTVRQCMDYKKSAYHRLTAPMQDTEPPFTAPEKRILEELYELKKRGEDNCVPALL